MTVDLTDPIFTTKTRPASGSKLALAEWSLLPALRFVPACAHGRPTGRPGLFHCPDCRGQFTVRTGQVMERSHIPLAKWVLAYHLMASSKKGISAHQLHRMLKVAYKTAWFMAHRIREAMREKNPRRSAARQDRRGRRSVPRQARDARPAARRDACASPRSAARVAAHRSARSSRLVERGGEVRATHMNHVTGKNLRDFMVRNADRKSRLHTDESHLYPDARQGVRHARDSQPRR